MVFYPCEGKILCFADSFGLHQDMSLLGKLEPSNCGSCLVFQLISIKLTRIQTASEQSWWQVGQKVTRDIEVKATAGFLSGQIREILAEMFISIWLSG